MIEIWRAVPGFEGSYEVSDQGRVRSLDRVHSYVKGDKWVLRRRRGQMMRLRTDKDGYREIGLMREGRQHFVRVHRLVLAAFVGPCPDTQEGCHNNGETGDNRLENLRYDTPVGNQQDKFAHGTDALGERNSSAKLTAKEVAAIRQSRDRSDDLAERYGVCQSQIVKIRNRSAWRRI